MNEWLGLKLPTVPSINLDYIGPITVWKNHPCGLWQEVERLKGYYFPFVILPFFFFSLFLKFLSHGYGLSYSLVSFFLLAFFTSHFVCLPVCLFETRYYHVVQVGLELIILLFQPPEPWDYNSLPSLPVLSEVVVYTLYWL